MSINAYIKKYPKEIQTILQKIRESIREVAPETTEVITYGIPTFKFNGKNLVHFGAWKNHIGFYATPSGNAAFKKELSKYKGAKGSVQFPLDKSIPYALIKKIVTYRVKEVTTKKK